MQEESAGKYKEIDQLRELRDRFGIHVLPLQGRFLGSDDEYPGVKVSIGEHIFEMYVSDEYKDLEEENQLMCLCLVLRELEQYDDASDYLAWCRYNNLNASDERARKYHMELRFIYREIEKKIGEINSFISDMDFELNAGAAQWLRYHGSKIS